MTRDGGASSLSKSSRSTCVALREYRLKLTPPRSTDAPSGALRPILDKACLAESPVEFSVADLLSGPIFIAQPLYFLAAHFYRCRRSAYSRVEIPQVHSTINRPLDLKRTHGLKIKTMLLESFDEEILSHRSRQLVYGYCGPDRGRSGSNPAMPEKSGLRQLRLNMPKRRFAGSCYREADLLVLKGIHPSLCVA